MRFFLFVHIFVLFISCHGIDKTPQLNDVEPDAERYFSTWFDKEIAENLHVSDPSYCFRRIQETIPKQWWRYAVERLYYRLPETLEYRLTDHWLDTAQLRLQDENVLSFIQLIRGCRLIDVSMYTNAISCLEESYHLAIKQHQPFRAQDAKRYMGRAYLLRGDYPKAAVMLTEVYDFMIDIPGAENEVRKFETMLELARVYQTSGDYQEALKWGRLSFQYAHQFPIIGQEVKALEYIGLIFLNCNNADSALVALRASEAIRDTHKLNYDESNENYLMGKALTQMGNYAEALPKLKLAESGNLETYNRSKIAEIQFSLGNCFDDIWLLDTALTYYYKALENTPDTAVMGEIHYKISGIYEKKDEIKAALTHHQLGAHYLNLFNRTKKNRDFGKLESRYALEREANRVKFLTEQNKIEQFKLTLALLLLLMTIGIALYITDVNKRSQLMLKQENELLEAKQYIQQQDIKLAKLSLSEKELEVVSLKEMVDLKNTLISKLEQPINFPENPDDIIMQLRKFTESEWNKFYSSFIEQYPGYSQRLTQQFPLVTKNEIRLIIFIKIGLETSKIADIFGISMDSLYRNRTRLRQKLGLDAVTNLEHFIRMF